MPRLADNDGDGTHDCNDQCPSDSLKTKPGPCDCGVPDIGHDADMIPDCAEPRLYINLDGSLEFAAVV